MSEQINRENVVVVMGTYLNMWDLVGIINENIKDEEERNALLDVIEGSEILLKQLKLEQKNAELRRQLEQENERLKEVINDQEMHICKQSIEIGDLKTANNDFEVIEQIERKAGSHSKPP